MWTVFYGAIFWRRLQGNNNRGYHLRLVSTLNVCWLGSVQWNHHFHREPLTISLICRYSSKKTPETPKFTYNFTNFVLWWTVGHIASVHLNCPDYCYSRGMGILLAYFSFLYLELLWMPLMRSLRFVNWKPWMTPRSTREGFTKHLAIR